MTKLTGIDYRKKYRGLIGIESKIPVLDKAALSVVYTPGVAAPCLAIQEQIEKSFDYTIRGNTVAIITDGSSVYGLGNVGPKAAIPMLEAKAAFLKTFAGIDAIPIALDTQNVEEIVNAVRNLAPTFGAFHLEDISAPRCFAIEEQCKRAVNLPIFHTDQHGTSVAVYAGLCNATKLINKELKNLKIVILGAGSAGIATARLLHHAGIQDLKVCDRHGLLNQNRPVGMNWMKAEIARMTNPDNQSAELDDVIRGADVFIGLSSADQLTQEQVRSMAKDPIVFALALSEPEIPYNQALAAGASIVATGRSDFPNQLNSSQVVPGIFRGALDVRATTINNDMFIAAAEALAHSVPEKRLNPMHILPEAMDFHVTAAIARAVAKAAQASGAAQTIIDPEMVEQKVLNYVYEGKNSWVSNQQTEEFNDIAEESLVLHERYNGMIETKAHVPIRDHYIYDLIYSAPNAAEPCQMIAENDELLYDLTCKKNLVAVVSDGSAVLGLGNIGGAAAMPVMEGKAVLFKKFGGVEALPICLATQDVDEIVKTVAEIAPAFGGVNLEDISAPRCFEIEKRLIELLDIPIFHDDQHGTAVVTLAGLINAAKACGKELSQLKVVVSGAGAAALSVSQLLNEAGVSDIIICDSKGAINRKRTDINPFKKELAQITNKDDLSGSLADCLHNAQVFIGLSVPGVMTADMVKSMDKDPIIFALANPTPEILPDEALSAGAKIVATGRSDFPNQVNNSLAFPGIFRGTLEVQATVINNSMKLAAAHAIAELVTEEELQQGTVIPGPFDYRVPPAVAASVAKAAMDNGVARRILDPTKVHAQLKHFLYEGQLLAIEP